MSDKISQTNHRTRGGIVPSDGSLAYELLRQSHFLYDPILEGGNIGPSFQQFTDLRPPHWINAKTLLALFGLPSNPIGWAILLMGYGFIPPTESDIRRALHEKGA
jgi:hypothetical protein